MVMQLTKDRVKEVLNNEELKNKLRKCTTEEEASLVFKEYGMDYDKIKELLTKINACETEEAALAVLKEYGLDFNSIEEFKDLIGCGYTDGELNDEELQAVQGGDDWGVCPIFGIAWGDQCTGIGVCFCFIGGVG